MKKKMYVFLFLLLFSAFTITQILIMRSKNLSGDSMSNTLKYNSFTKFNLEFLSPDDWNLYDVSESSQNKEGILQNLIITGGSSKGHYPLLEIYLSNNHAIESIIQSDVTRINDEYENKLTDEVEIEYGSGIISYNFVDDETFLKKEGGLILCKDWVGEKSDCVLVFSICATEEQWEILDEQFDMIINSVTVME
ncbi:MAG: hypothetical protein H0S79_18395 [Anaerolineaceae bacterium]|nr:hypothetical protein [Anaerolineaceae bacterium]